MAPWFRHDREIDEWLRPFTGAVVVPGGKRVLRTDTRLFFDLYWQLLGHGYGEDQIAEYALRIKWRVTPVDEDLALVAAVFGLALHRRLQPSPRFRSVRSARP